MHGWSCNAVGPSATTGRKGSESLQDQPCTNINQTWQAMFNYSSNMTILQDYNPPFTRNGVGYQWRWGGVPLQGWDKHLKCMRTRPLVIWVMTSQQSQPIRIEYRAWAMICCHLIMTFPNKTLHFVMPARLPGCKVIIVSLTIVTISQPLLSSEA